MRDGERRNTREAAEAEESQTRTTGKNSRAFRSTRRDVPEGGNGEDIREKNEREGKV